MLENVLDVHDVKALSLIVCGNEIKKCREVTTRYDLWGLMCVIRKFSVFKARLDDALKT